MPELEPYIAPYQYSSQYSDPYSKDGKTESLSSGLFTMAKNFVVFGAAMAVTGAILGKTSQGIASLINKQKSTNFKDLGAWFKSTDIWKQGISDLGIVKSLSSKHEIYQQFVESQAKRFTKLQTNAPFRLGTSLYKYETEKFMSFWGKDNLSNRLTGKAVEYGRTVFRGSIYAYVADRSLGILRRDPNNQRPSLLNLPGVAYDFLKITVQTAPMALVFGGGLRFAGRVMSHAAYRGTQATFVALKNAGVTPEKTYNALQWMSNKVWSMHGKKQAADEFYEEIRSVFTAKGIRGFLDGSKVWYKAKESWDKKIAEVASERKNADKLGFVRQMFDAMHRSPTRAREHSIADTEVLTSREKFLKSSLKGQYRASQTVFNEFLDILGFRPKIIAKSDIQRVSTEYPIGYGDVQEQSFTDWMWNITRNNKVGKTPLMSEGLYTFRGGKELDIRNLLPSKIMDDATRFLHGALTFNIPFVGNIDIFSLFHPQRFFPRNATNTLTLQGRKSVFVGHPFEKDPSLNKIPDKIKKNLSILDDKGFLHLGKDEKAIYNFGKWWYSGSKGELHQLTPDNIFNQIMFEHSSGGGFKDSYLALLGAKGRRKIESSTEKVANFRDIFDLNKTDKGIFGWLFGIGRKFTDTDNSPLYYFKQLERISNVLKTNDFVAEGVDGEFITNFIKETSNLLVKSGKHSSVFRKKSVLIKMFPELFLNKGGLSKDNVVNMVRNVVKETRLAADEGLARPDLEIAEKLIKRYKITDLLNEVDSSMGLSALDNIAKSTYDNAKFTKQDQMIEFLAANRLMRHANQNFTVSGLEKITDTLMKKGDLNEIDSLAVKNWAGSLWLENMIPKDVDAETLKTMMGFLNLNEKNVEKTINMLYPTLSSIPPKIHSTRSPNSYIDTTVISVPWRGEVHRGNIENGQKFSKGDFYGYFFANRFNRLLDFFGLGLDEARYSTGSEMLAKGIGMRRLLPIVGAMVAYNYADNLTAMNPMFNGSLLNNGITAGVAEGYTKLRLMQAAAFDMTGVTAATKYAEGLMPGVINSPISRGFRGIGPVWLGAALGTTLGGPIGGGVGLAAGLGISGFLGFGMTDLTKSGEELNQIFTGEREVPIMKGRWWDISSSPWQGTSIEMFRPHQLALARSGYLNTPDAFGSNFEQMLYKPWPFIGINPIGFLLGGRDHYTEKRMYSRPYPLGEIPFTDLPLIGPALASTVGRVLFPPTSYHEAEMQKAYERLGYGPESEGGMPTSTGGLIPGTSQLRRALPVSPGSFSQAVGSTMYSAEEMAGIIGFAGQTLTEKTFGFSQPFESQPTLATANMMTSLQRAYWDKNLGGLLGTCWIAGTKILTEDGRKNIEDIFIGEKIISADGQLHEVQNILRRKADDLYKIHVGIVDVDLIGTSKHHIPILKKEKCILKLCNNILCLPNIKKRCKKCSKRFADIQIEDVNLKDIKEGDYCILPILQSSDVYPIIDLSMESDRNYDEKYIYNRGSIEFIKAYNLLESGKCKTRKELRSFVDDKCGKEALRAWKTKRIQRFLRYVTITPELAYVCGWYISEGSVEDSGRVQFSMNKKEILYAKKIQDIIKNIFFSNSSITEDDENSLIVRTQCIPLALLAKKLFGSGAKNKYIPYIIKTLPKDALIELFKGVHLGDGFSNIKSSGFHSSSSFLVRDLFDIGLSLGFIGSLNIDYLEKVKENTYYPHGNKRQDTVSSYIQWNIPSTIKIYNLLYDKNVNVSEGKVIGSFTYDKKLFCPVRSVNFYSSDEVDVFDIQVEDLHYYIAEHILVHNTELWRRFVPRRRTQLDTINFIPNLMPDWMPTQYLIGDPFTKVPFGEAVLPGYSYNKTHKVNMTYPIEASMLGMTTEDMVAKMTGVYRSKPVDPNDLERINERIQLEAKIFDPITNISGTYSGIIRQGKRKIVKKIKDISTAQLQGFVGPTDVDTSEINYLMGRLGLTGGEIEYQYKGQPLGVFPTEFSVQRYKADVQAALEARETAKILQSEGFGLPGAGYSHLDRYRILANIAPSSPEVKTEKALAQQETKYGINTQEDFDLVKKHHDSRIRGRELYPYRFAGKILSPDFRYNLMSENEDIKAAAEYSLPERIGGALWEFGTHGNNILSNKFMPYKTPLEAYQSQTLYGRTFKSWSSPIDHFADAYSRGFMSKTSPITGAIAGGTGGLFFGGSLFTGTIGAVAGAAYGTAHGLYRAITDTTYIPGMVKKEREILDYFDELEYQKNKMLYNSTGDMMYSRKMGATMTGYDINDMRKENWSQLFRAAYPSEKPYLMGFIKETDNEERAEILKYVPGDLGGILQNKWKQADLNAANALKGSFAIYKPQLSGDLSRTSITHELPSADWSGWGENVNTDDVMLKTVDNLGYESHDFGVGYYKQQQRIANSPFLPEPITMGQISSERASVPSFEGGTELRRLVEMALQKNGIEASVSVTSDFNSSNTLIIIG